MNVRCETPRELARSARVKLARAGMTLTLGALILWAGTLRADTTNGVRIATLEEVSRALAHAKTVFTHFVQERHLSLFNEPLRSEGYLCFEQPGRVRWEVTRPYQSILVSDGSGVAQFEWVDGKWKKLDIGLAGAMQNVVSQIAGIMRGEYARQAGEHTVSLSNSAQGPVVTLIPRNEKMRKVMQSIEVHLAPDLKGTRRVVLREKEGDFTSIEFDEQVVNQPFQAQTFDRKTPLALDRIRQTAKTN